MKMEGIYLYEIIFQIRTYFPNSSTFALFNVVLKSIGIILYTHNIKGLEDQNLTIHSILVKFLIRRFKPYDLFKAASFFFFGLLLLYLLFIAVSLLLYHKIYLNNMSNQIFKNNLLLKKQKSRYHRLSICLSSLFMIILSLINQHIIEILFVSVSSLSGVLNQKLFKNYENPSLVNLLPLGIVNIITIILLAFFYVVFLILSMKKVEVVNFGYKTHCNYTSFIFIFISIFLQGLYSITALFQNENRILAQMLMTVFIVVFIVFDLLMNIGNVSIYCSFVSKCIYAIKLDCLFSGLIELILYFTADDPISQQMSVFKQFIEILIVIIIFTITFHIWELKQIDVISKNILLQTNSKITIKHLIIFFNVLKRYFSFDSKDNFNKIFDLVHNHIIQCINQHCPCHRITSFDSKGAEMPKNSKIEKIIKDIILIGEQEINNLIYNSLQSQEHSELEELYLLHIDYIALIKHDFVFSFYLSHCYYHKSKGHNWGFVKRYYLYEIKKTILSSYLAKKKTIPNRLTSKKLNISSSNSSQLFNEVFSFHSYLIAVSTLHKCIYYCCSNLESTISYLSFSNIKKKNSSSELIINLFNENIELNRALYSNYINYFLKKKYKNMEVNYLLTNYLLLYYGEIPIEYKNKFSHCLLYSTLKKRSSFYNQYSKENDDVIITSMESNDTFKVTYASQSFCDHFNWTKQKLLYRDFNDLLPQQIGSFHNTYMKLFALFENSTYAKSCFILDETKSLHNVSLSAKKMIDISEGFSIIFIINRKKAKEKDDEREYHILLDYNFNIMNMSEAFEMQFYFSKQMLIQLRLDFFQLFGINKHKLASYFKQLLKTHPKPPAITEIVKAITIHHTISNQKLFNYRGFHNFQLFFHKSVNIVREITIKRTEYNMNLSKIFQTIQDLNLENNFLERLINCKQLLSKTMTKKEENEELNLTLTLKNINSLFYYVILLKETTVQNYNFPSIYIEKESYDNILSYKGEDCYSPKISTLKNRSRQSIKSQFSPSRTKSPTSSISFLDNHISIDKSVNTTNIKLINSTHLQMSKKRKRNSIIKKTKVNKEFIQWFDNKFENRSLFITIFLIEVCLVLTTIYYYYSLQLSLKIFYINYFSFVLKDDLMFCSLFFIRRCLIRDSINPFKSSDLTSTFRIRNDLFLLNMNKALASVNALNSYNQLLPIYQSLYNTTSYRTLRDDWTESTYNSTLIEELHKIYFFFRSVLSEDKFTSCSVKLYGKPNYKDLTRAPRLEEKVLCYINANMLRVIINQLNRFSNLSLRQFQVIHEFASEIYIFLYVFSLLFCFLLYVIIVVILIHDKVRIKHSLEKIYILENEDKNSLKMNLSLLKTAADEFTKINCKRYEESLKFKSSVIQLNKKKEKLLNSSLIQPDNLKEDNIITNSNNNNNSETIQLFRLSFENLKHFSNLTQIDLVQQIFIIVTTLFILNFSLHIVNLVQADQKYNFLAIQNDLGTNFIAQIPMYAQLVLYALTSIIQNNPNSIPYIFNANTSNIPNLYNVSVDVEKESIYTVLNGSNYLFVLFKLSIIQKTLEKYLDDTSREDLFNESINWHNMFNQKNYFPIAASVGFTQYFTQCDSLSSCLTLVNSYAIENLYVSNQLSLNGFDLLFNLMITELNNLFVDYKTNYTKEYDNIALLSNNDLWIIIENAMRVLSQTSNVFNQVTGNDINNAYLKSQNQRMSFSVLLITFSLLSIYTIIMIMLIKLRRVMVIIETVGDKISKIKQIHCIE